MMKISLMFLFLISFSGWAQPPTIVWQKCLGGTQADVGVSIQKTSDGKYVLGGSTDSNDGDVSGFHQSPYSDYWVVKIDSSGSIIWQKCFGGLSEDEVSSVTVESTGNILISGWVASDDGDVNGSHGTTETWVVKCDSTGNMIRQKCYGGSDEEHESRLFLDKNGDYVVISSTISNDGDVLGSHLNSTCSSCEDAWMFRTDTSGSINYSKCFGGSWGDAGIDLLLTADSGYILLCGAKSDDGDVSGLHGLPGGGIDYWLVKTDHAGNILWQKCYGGTYNEKPYRIIQTLDNGFLMIGSAQSLNYDVTGNHGFDDVWVLKTDSSGNIEWQKCFGGSSFDSGTDAIQFEDSSYLILAYTNSNDGDVIGLHGNSVDAWLLKLDKSGQLVWQKCYGGSQDDRGLEFTQTTDGGFLMCGTSSSNDGDVSGNHGFYDVWLVKLSSLYTGVDDNSNSPDNLIVDQCSDCDFFTVNFFLKESKNVKIQLFDVAGRLINSTTMKGEPGINKQQIQLHDISKGLYFVNLITPNVELTKKIVID